ncbi:hypothetical protein ACPA9J_11050 [Pseudomonas aeruginosa]
MAERAEPLLAVLLQAPPCVDPWFLECRQDRAGLTIPRPRPRQPAHLARRVRRSRRPAPARRCRPAGILASLCGIRGLAVPGRARRLAGPGMPSRGLRRPRDQGRRRVFRQWRRSLPERAVLVATEGFPADLTAMKKPPVGGFSRGAPATSGRSSPGRGR